MNKLQDTDKKQSQFCKKNQTQYGKKDTQLQSIFIFWMLFFNSGFSVAESEFVNPSFQELLDDELIDQEELEIQIHSAKKRVSATRQEQLEAELAYLRCSNELRSLLSKELPFFKKIQSNFGMGEMLILAPKAPDSKALYESVLNSCEQKKNNYQLVNQSYRESQRDYLARLSLVESEDSKWKSEKSKILSDQKEYIKLLFRRIHRTLVPHSHLFWSEESLRELEHLRNLDETVYNEFIKQIEKKSKSVPIF